MKKSALLLLNSYLLLLTSNQIFNLKSELFQHHTTDEVCYASYVVVVTPRL